MGFLGYHGIAVSGSVSVRVRQALNRGVIEGSQPSIARMDQAL